jgi:hypothetical protein
MLDINKNAIIQKGNDSDKRIAAVKEEAPSEEAFQIQDNQKPPKKTLQATTITSHLEAIPTRGVLLLQFSITPARRLKKKDL